MQTVSIFQAKSRYQTFAKKPNRYMWVAAIHVAGLLLALLAIGR